MSATTTRLPRSEATAIAWELVALLAPYCERIEVLGSIRRQRPTVGDIELLAIPKWRDAPGTNLFGESIHEERINLLEEHIRALQADGLLHKRQPQRWGPKYKAALYGDPAFPVDLYICLPPAQWGVLSVIRTGSNTFCKRLVTPWEQGGWMPPGMFCHEGALWRDGVMLETPGEGDVFAALGKHYIRPWDREV